MRCGCLIGNYVIVDKCSSFATSIDAECSRKYAKLSSQRTVIELEYLVQKVLMLRKSSVRILREIAITTVDDAMYSEYRRKNAKLRTEYLVQKVLIQLLDKA